MRFAGLLLLSAATAFAGEYAVLTTGARLHADRHESIENDKVRLYSTGDAYTEIAAALVSHFEVEEAKPVPPAATPAAAAPPQLPATQQPKDPRQLVDEAADRYGLPRHLLHSLVKAESAYHPDALSPKGAIGLMQLMPGTASLLGANPHDPAQNVDAGARHLRDLLLKYDGGLYRALAAYNAGAGAVEKYRGVPPYRETVLYIQKIVRDSGLGAGNDVFSRDVPARAGRVFSMRMRAVRLGTVLGLLPALWGASPSAWVPMRWNYNEPKALDLLSGTPVNCLLVRSWTPDLAREASARKIDLLAIVRNAGEAEKAAGAGFAGTVIEGDYPADTATQIKAAFQGTVVELPLRSRMRLDASPIAGSTQGVWPGVHAEENGTAKAGPTGSPWIDTNNGFLRSIRAAAGSTVWIANEPPAKNIVTAQNYLQAIADAAITGARWVVALDDDFSARLLKSDPAAVRDWKRIAQHLQFYEDHPEWRAMPSYGRLAIVQDPAKGGTLSGGILDMIAAKHTPVRPVPPGRLTPAALEGAKMAVNLDAGELTPEQSEVLKNFTRAGGTLLTAPAGWKDQGAQGDRITLDKQEVKRLDDIFRDVQALVGRRNLGVRLFNVSSMLSNLIAAPDGKQVVVHLVNYSGFTVENIAVHFLGKFTQATLIAPGGAKKPLEIYQTEEGGGVDVPEVGVCAAVILQ